MNSELYTDLTPELISKLDSYIDNNKPKKYVKGTKMNFVGLKKVEDIANLVLFLRDQSDNPVPLP